MSAPPPEEPNLRCHRCGCPLAPGAGAPVARAFRLAAALALGAVHAGMWLWTDLANPYCRRCRRWLSFLSAGLAMGALVGAVAGFRWAFRRGILRPME